MQPIGVAHVSVGLEGCHGVVRFIVVEQDIPPLMSVDANVASTFGSGQRWNFRRFGGQADFHTLESGHTATGGWCPPPTNSRCLKHFVPTAISPTRNMHYSPVDTKFDQAVVDQTRVFALRNHHASLRGQRMSHIGLFERATLPTQTG